ncbi:hypothetical protein PAXINDRAFT_103972 [Paxillus involutus ATCC 200175]|uniref:Uncharacterized protein n=1 Tax=Paxillus involutus ATCC 200175 TaxID=664439 RepID=A0A0C9T9I7_PAXIN|nr:hypothetical protein PAXINDRAFT_103972 [Paxillus involutus ATCC 200175]
MCRRKVFDVCFNNVAADTDYLECDTTNSQGCARCRVTQPLICCDIHHPSEFSAYDSNIQKPLTLSRSRTQKYTKGKHDFMLQDALDDWRDAKTITVYGWARLNDLGPALIMPNSILDRIIDCAHHHKINTIQDLRKETGWTDAELFGEEVIGIIQRCTAPLPLPLISTPLRPSTSSAINTSALSVSNTSSLDSISSPSSVAPKRRTIKCGACGKEGHNSRNRICLKHPSRNGGSEKENEDRISLPT